MARFWVYVGDKVQGPVDIPSLRKVPGFNLLTQVCQEGDETWRVADEVIEIKSYFLSPPRPNSFVVDVGNTAPKLDLPVPKSDMEEMTLPEPNTSWQKVASQPKPGEPVLEILSADEPKKESVAAGPGAALRAVCAVCGYKNPRDVAVCMKCGEKLAAPAKTSETKAMAQGNQAPAAAPIPNPIPTSAPSLAPAPVAAVPIPASSTMVEVPISKLIAGIAVAALISGGSFLGYRSWKKHHVPKGEPAVPVQVSETSATHRPIRRSTKRYSHRPGRRHTAYGAATLPGVSNRSAAGVESAPAEPKPQEASYHVVTEATPLKKRFSSPVNSPYAVKRRADQSLWTSQEEQAIRQVQENRIYGGQRTIQRNVDILMQILRDREYTTAFESGKRIYLYNDLDWSAAMKEGPVYEVRLTFSGGREPDGSPKKPLHFAFASDLERGTVEPGGEEQVRSNTLHAFFDESRIAPEDRRAIAKDTEELVMAAQPDASPLAFDTVVRQFAKVYTTAALSRVAEAYDLTLVKKKLDHDPRLGSDESGDTVMPVQPVKGQEPMPPLKPVETPAPAQVKPLMAASKGGPVEFRMEQGQGRERTVSLTAGSAASLGRIWEVLTGYDRLKEFMPDMLTSEREGQDGAAVIVHTVCLTRYMVFVYKENLHFRVIEHPREYTLDFERIAGDYESIRGSVQVVTDPATRVSQIIFHATVVPSGHVMNRVLETMARRLLIPQIEAIRAKAESN